MKHALLPVAAFVLNACATPHLPGSPVREEGLGSYGQPTPVGRLTITPHALVDDSRCPINARCVWTGRWILKTRIAGAGWRDTVDLTLGQTYATNGTGVTLVSAEPGKMAGSVPATAANLFGFETC